MYHRGREQDKERIVWEKGWEERAWEMAGRGEEDTRDWLFSGGRPVSDVRPGLVPNSTKGSPTSEARTPYTCFHLKSHQAIFSFSSLYFLTCLTYPRWATSPPETFSISSSSKSSATHCSPLRCAHSYHYCLTSRLSSLPRPHRPSSPFTLTVFVALIANESQNLSVLRTCTTHLCVGQRFKDESLSTQRLYMHAFAFKNTEPDRHPRRDRWILYIYFPPPCPFLTHAPVFEQTANYYTRRKHEIWPVQRHNDRSIFHTFIFIRSYLYPHFFSHFNPLHCLYYHTYCMQVAMILFIHQSA